jgi:hypothetical protein
MKRGLKVVIRPLRRLPALLVSMKRGLKVEISISQAF